MVIKKNLFITEEIIEAVLWVNTLLRGKVTFCGSFGLVANDLLHRPIHDIDCISDDDLYGHFFEEIGQYGISSSGSAKFTLNGVLVKCFKLVAHNGVHIDVMYREDGCKSERVLIDGGGHYCGGELRIEVPESAINVKRNYLNLGDRVPNPESFAKHTADLKYIDSLLKKKKK